MSSNKENYKEIEEKGKRLEVLIKLSNSIREKDFGLPIPFNDFLYLATEKPNVVFRDVFQLFHDMVHYFIPEIEDDIHNMSFAQYDTTNLFINDCDNPFFADKLFANRFMDLVKGFRKGIQNNHIYLFEGPPGSGKSTFLNNLLNKLEIYTNLPEGQFFKTKWSLDIDKIGGYCTFNNLAEKTNNPDIVQLSKQFALNASQNRTLEFSCPNNDHPILQIPVAYRADFLDELITDAEFKDKLFNSKEYKWVLKDIPCSICNSLYSLLLDAIGDPLEIFSMLQAKHHHFNRQFGDGISIFSPGDPMFDMPISNMKLQNQINDLFNNDDIKFVYSYLAKTNNGVLALMDIKEHNIHRMMSLHGIISDGVHKVDLVEEQIKTLFFGLVNPEDKRHYESLKSFQDRIININVPYILDYNTEVSIYRNKFGEKIQKEFLPRVLENFAKIVIATRLERDSPAILSWLERPDRYRKYIDKDLLLLKMEIYAGRVPSFLSEEDLKRFNPDVRKKVITDSEREGRKGFSGRKSLNLFNTFYSKYSESDNLISMVMVKEFFLSKENDLEREIPDTFIDSLMDLYDFNVLQEIKESVYYYNENQIAKDILNYLFAVNFEIGDTKVCSYTNDTIEITEDYFKNFEALLLGTTSTNWQRTSFRKDVHQEYITKTLAQEIRLQRKNISDTEQFKNLFDKYTRNLKENALAPYQDNQNFRRAVNDFGTQAFNSYDDRTKRDVNLLISNLQTKFKYAAEGAKQVSLYVLDKKLSKKY